MQLSYSLDLQESLKSYFLKRAPLDLLQHFYLYLDGVSIGRLLLSGDKYILNSLGNGSAVLDFRMRQDNPHGGLGQLPSSSLLSKLTRLRRISVSSATNIRQTAIHAFSPVNLSPTLLEITFSFSWAEWVWRTVSHYRNPSFVQRENMTQAVKDSERQYDMTHMFPSLLRFELNGRPALSNAFIVNLPSGLTAFNLLQNDAISQEGISHLPRELHELRLPEIALFQQEDLLSLPSHLTILQLKRVNSPLYHLLPKSITDLTFSDTVIEDEKHLAGLPDCLASLRTEFTLKVQKDWLKRLPSSLTWFESRFRHCEDLFTVADLPRSLTYFATSTTALVPQSFSRLPPSLHTLRCYGGDINGRDAVNLPPSVQRLELCSTVLVDWDFLLRGRKIATVMITDKR